MNNARSLPLALSLMVVAVCAAAATDSALSPRTPIVEIHPGATWLSFPARLHPADPDPADLGHGDRAGGELGAVVALPTGTATATVSLVSGKAGAVELVGHLQRMRGVPVATVRIADPGEGPLTVVVHHDGDWHGKSDARLASPALHAGLPGLPDAGLKAASAELLGGSYVIICAPQLAQTVAPLAGWKTRKGWPVVVATTDETGNTGAAIRGWLQQAYDDWPQPPEYVLLVGDVEDIPTFYLGGNVTDLPYTLLDGDDWLPDVMLGRLAVDNAAECAAVVAKTIHYEREPFLDQTDWFTRGVMIGGQYGSTTPMHTVRFCGEQLASIGFSPLVPVTPVQLEGNYIVSPYIASEQVGVPQNMGPQVITPAINAGCSVVVYRGWAYGTGGWFSPTYQVANIQTLTNGAMLPVVMSFVCHTGNFAATVPSMGEVFIRLGGSTPETFRGAVAFYGNGEPWSRTRYNDAMAISLFEQITDPQLTTLGSLINAGKLRFMEFYPGSLDEIGDGFSVEYYFHIYNLLGDPELNYHRSRPTPLLVTHPETLPAGTSLIDVTVEEAGGGALAGARIGIVQADQLLGATLTGPDGVARVVLASPVTDGPVDLTVTRPGRVAYTAQLNAATHPVYLALDDMQVTDLEGEPLAVRPAASLVLRPTLRNLGTEPSGAAALNLDIVGPAQIVAGASTLQPLAPGATGQPAPPFGVAVAATAADGAVIAGHVTVSHGDQDDQSGFILSVQAPRLELDAATAGGDRWVEPGATTDLWLTVTNAGSAATAGGTLAFSLAGPAGAVVVTANLTFGSLAAAGGQLELGPLTLQLDPAVAAGATLNIRVEVTHDDGAEQVTSLPVAVGRGDVTEPSGPDGHGYYAYDSADFLYPDQRPVYRWREISTAYGGDGIRLPLNTNNYDRRVIVDLPFAFTFYGEAFDRVRVSDNGWLSFDADNDFYNFYNWPIPLAHGNGALVAPFWDNLTPEPHANPEADPVGMDSDGVYWYHDEAAGEVIFQWSRMRHIYDEIPEIQTFQAVLRDPAVHPATPTGDGEILFFYKQVADNDHLRMYATVGIESPDETDGLQLTYDGVRKRGFAPLGPGMAVRLTTAPPVRVPLTVASLTRQQTGVTAQLAWTLSDERPLVGWRVYAVTDNGRVCLTPEPLPAQARSAVLAADPGCDLVLEALLPFGGVSEAGKAVAGAADLRFALHEPVPNPLRSQTSLAFAVPRTGRVMLRVFDVRGRLVTTLLDGRAEAGTNLVVWQGRDDRGRQLADGVYFLRLEQGGQSQTRKLLLVR
jgi:hypothetical protein